MGNKVGNQALNHITGLDGLRGLAIIFVVLYHLFPLEFKGGFIGVPLFFVLSGYLMAVLSEERWKKKQFKVAAFYKSRFRRIYPPLIFFVGVVCFLQWVFVSNGLDGKQMEVGSILLGYNNQWQIAQNTSYFDRVAQASPFIHMWSLAIEIQFYLVWPLFYIGYKALQRTKYTQYVYLFPLGLAVLSMLSMTLGYRPDTDVTAIYYSTFTRISAVLFGAWLGLIREQPISRKIPLLKKTYATVCFGVISVLILWCVLYLDGQNGLTYYFGLSFVTVLLGSFLWLVVHPRYAFGKLLDNPVFVWFGTRSYELYLWHYAVLFFFHMNKFDLNWITLPIVVLIMGLLTEWTYRAISPFYLSFGKIYRYLETHKVTKLIKYTVAAVTLVSFVGYGALLLAPYEKKTDTAVLQEELQKNEQTLTNQSNLIVQTQENAGEKEITFIGDSVMLGAIPTLKEQFPKAYIDAAKSRQLYNSDSVIQELKNNEHLYSTVVLGLGTNGPFREDSGQAILNLIGNDKKIYWINVYGRYLQTQTQVNKMIETLASKNSNVTIIDWASVAQQHPEWFYNDGIHLNTDGQKAYVDFLKQSIK